MIAAIVPIAAYRLSKNTHHAITLQKAQAIVETAANRKNRFRATQPPVRPTDRQAID